VIAMDSVAARRKQTIAAVLALPRSVVLSHLASHALLLAGCLVGGIPYVMLQILLAVEALLISAASMFLYSERGLWRHLFDLLKLSVALAFVMIFLLASYAVVTAGEGAEPLVALRSMFDTRSALTWGVAYLAMQVTASYLLARRSTDPRLFWARENLVIGGATFVAMFLMVFLTFFLAVPLVAILASAGCGISPDALLSLLMVALRFLLVLVANTISSEEMVAMARNPYVD